jgi:hypothetical protein
MAQKQQKTLAQKQADFILGLAKQEVLPSRGRKLKSVSLEKMADLYLAKLAREEKTDVFLNEFLEERGIYFTIHSIQQCLELLTEKKFIVLVPFGFSTFKISRAKGIWERRTAEIWQVPLYTITDAGLHFVLGGQELNSAGRENRLSERKKWQERFITASITLLGGIILAVLKWYFIDRK